MGTIDNPKYPETMTISVTASGSSNTHEYITAKIEDLDKNPPPNPTADDRNNSYSGTSVPERAARSTASWIVRTHYWKEYWFWRIDWVWILDGCTSACSKYCNGKHGHWEDHGDYWIMWE